jgi:phosphatidylinositol alpha 1,6-mannosyltransferase
VTTRYKNSSYNGVTKLLERATASGVLKTATPSGMLPRSQGWGGRHNSLQVPRVALLADSFHEVNGAARTCRELDAFARRREYPFFSIRYGPGSSFEERGPVWTLQLLRSRFSIQLDPDLYFDPLFLRDRKLLLEQLRRFRPDVIHIISPGDLGMLGAIAADRLGVPLVVSWHTNIHEFASRRVEKMLSRVNSRFAASLVERFVLNRTVKFYSRGDVLLAPNEELLALLRARTGKPVFMMARGVDTELFSPSRRTRRNGPFTLGFVGRLMPEKNVRLLARLEAELLASGRTDFEFLIVGGGGEKEWLEHNLKQVRLPGVLSGDELSEAYANMDVFIFPSHTDTFGNVIQEAMASGIPAIVTSSGGPKFLVRHGETGYVAEEPDFVHYVRFLMDDPVMLARLKRAARAEMVSRSWDRVFEKVYQTYGTAAGQAAVYEQAS